MESVCFRTRSPYDDVQRSLDILRRMGFELKRLSVEVDSHGFLVHIEFHQRGILSTKVFVDRLLQIGQLELYKPPVEGAEPEDHAFPAMFAAEDQKQGQVACVEQRYARSSGH